MSKNRVYVGRKVRLDLKKIRCGQCREKIGDHATFMLAHVVNANDTTQHGLVPLCGPCFMRNGRAVGEAIEAIREVAAGHRASASTERPN